MNILFLTIGNINNLSEKGIYTDLIRQFNNEGNKVYVVHPIERRLNKETELIVEQGIRLLKIKSGNLTKTNLIEKGISTLSIEQVFLKQIKKHFKNVKFDLIIYSTPPITFEKIIKYIKKRDGAKSYLLLKDIFPQNAVDLEIFSKRSLIYKFFRKKEVKLYQLSDYIGCMSEANKQYIIKHNSYIDSKRVEVNPNTIQPSNHFQINNKDMRIKYNIPLDKAVFIYGGNLGKPQGIDFIIKCLKSTESLENVYFVIVGSGTEYNKLEEFIKKENPKNIQLLEHLPKRDYEQLVKSCDVGLVFLDYKFTIPNFPSRILSYMDASMPILAVTDPNTDVGEIIQNEYFGCWALSNDVNDFLEKINVLLNKNTRKEMGINARNYLVENYHVRNSYEIIMKHFM